jgi:AraC family transcriptional regulator, exoenzyme S synthesis regulatory protein ExsA
MLVFTDKMINRKISVLWDYVEETRFQRDVRMTEGNADRNTLLYNFEAKESYFFVASRKPISSSLPVHNRPKALAGGYLLIEIRSTNLPCFYAGIALSWLQEQLRTGEAALNAAIQQVMFDWQKEGHIVASKHLLFQKNFGQGLHRFVLSQNYFFELLYQFLSSMEVEVRGGNSQKFRENEILKIMEVEAMVIQNLSQSPPTIDKMAFMAGMNSSKFKLLFKEIFGQSPHQYILEKKLQYAEELLKSGKYTLTQIAYKLGYNHTSGFTRIYKKKFHEPSDYSRKDESLQLGLKG